MRNTILFSTMMLMMPFAFGRSSSARPPQSHERPRIERLDPALDQLIASDAQVEIVADGFDWSEGPVWVKEGGFLLFSDVPKNQIHRWRQGEDARVYMKPSGYTGAAPRGGEMGSNGLAIDPGGHLVLCQHGDRRVARMDDPLRSPQPTFVTLADRYQGKRFNSPNDLVFRSNGDLYFTDPPYGMEKQFEDPRARDPISGSLPAKRQGRGDAPDARDDAAQRPRVFARREAAVCLAIRSRRGHLARLRRQA